MHGVFGKKNPQWKGRCLMKNGYIRISIQGERVYEHRYKIEKMLGRKLKRNEVIHHKNGNKTDNRIGNLLITNQSDHAASHKPMLGKKSKVQRDKKSGRFIHAKK